MNHLISNLKIQLYSIEQRQLGIWWNYKNVNSPFTRLYYAPSAQNTWVEYHGKRHMLSPEFFLAAPPYTPVNYHCGHSCTLFGILLTAELVSGIEFFSLNGMNLQCATDEMVPLLFKRLLLLNPGKEVPIADPSNRSYNEKLRQLTERNETFPNRFETDSMLRLLISRFVSDETPLFSKSDSTISSRILKIIEYIDQHLDQPLSLPILAEQVHLNPTYLSNSFTDYLKVRPTTYIKQRRIEKAQRLLLSTNYPMKRIAFEVGIPNEDYFFRIFKNHMHCTPSEYRAHMSPSNNNTPAIF